MNDVISPFRKVPGPNEPVIIVLQSENGKELNRKQFDSPEETPIVYLLDQLKKRNQMLFTIIGWNPKKRIMIVRLRANPAPQKKAAPYVDGQGFNSL